MAPFGLDVISAHPAAFPADARDTVAEWKAYRLLAQRVGGLDSVEVVRGGRKSVGVDAMLVTAKEGQFLAECCQHHEGMKPIAQQRFRAIDPLRLLKPRAERTTHLLKPPTTMQI